MLRGSEGAATLCYMYISYFIPHDHIFFSAFGPPLCHSMFHQNKLFSVGP